MDGFRLIFFVEREDDAFAPSDTSGGATAAAAILEVAVAVPSDVDTAVDSGAALDSTQPVEDTGDTELLARRPRFVALIPAAAAGEAVVTTPTPSGSGLGGGVRSDEPVVAFVGVVVFNEANSSVRA